MRVNHAFRLTDAILTRLQDAEDRSISMAIHQALLASVRLETFPKSTVDIFITVIEADGMENCVASGSVAASAALADAGIEIFGLVSSCSAVSSTSPFLDILTMSRLSLEMRSGSTRH